MGNMMGGPPAKALNFKTSLRRLVATLRGDRRLVAIAGVLAVVSVTLSVIAPKIMGNATNLIFEGLVGGRLPAGATKAQAVAQLRASGQSRIADMVSAMDLVPGRGVDFAVVGAVLLGVLVIYVAAFFLSWFQGRVVTVIVQRTVYRMRADVEGKFGRMPLSYFDSTPRGELLSRVTNDIDNVAQSLQQTMSQLLTSLLTVIAGPCRGGADHGAGLSPHHDDHRQAFPAPVRRPVEDHGPAQRPYRGGLHRPRAGQGLRSHRRNS